MTTDIFADIKWTGTPKPELPELDYLLSPRDSEDAVSPYWTSQDSLDWRRIFDDYGHKKIWQAVETGELEGVYVAWLKSTNRDFLLNS